MQGKAERMVEWVRARAVHLQERPLADAVAANEAGKILGALSAILAEPGTTSDAGAEIVAMLAERKDRAARVASQTMNDPTDMIHVRDVAAAEEAAQCWQDAKDCLAREIRARHLQRTGES